MATSEFATITNNFTQYSTKWQPRVQAVLYFALVWFTLVFLFNDDMKRLSEWLAVRIMTWF
jgi:hypothetical protein